MTLRNSTFRNSTLVSAAFAALCTVASPAMAAETHITAEFAAGYDRIRPDPYKGIQLKNTLEVTLSGLSEVKESNTRDAGSVADNQKALKILGQKSPGGGSSWTVAGPNRLERLVESPQSIATMTIEVSGTECKFNVEFKLKPGFTEYKFKQIRNGEMGYFTEPKIESTKCTIK
jgi:hypothetical protein